MSASDRLRQLADEIDAENYHPELPPATSVLDGIEQLKQIIPEGRMCMSIEWRPGQQPTLIVAIYDKTFNCLAHESTVNAAVANAIRKIQSQKQSEDAYAVPAEIAIAVALPEPEDIAF